MQPGVREFVANSYLAGEGIEIGALHIPLSVPPEAHVRYVDRLSVDDLRTHYPELQRLPLVPIDILDDGQTLASFADASQDFVIANHFIEHAEDPIRTIENILRVLRPNGVLYMAIPDKRYTFDCERQLTPFAHLLTDYHGGTVTSKPDHFREWVTFVQKLDGEEAEAEYQRLLAIDYSIHYHVWTETEIMELFVGLRQQLGFPFSLELLLRNDEEVITVLRKV
jgi:predicted SAM-dependent methyltransferase